MKRELGLEDDGNKRETIGVIQGFCVGWLLKLLLG